MAWKLPRLLKWNSPAFGGGMGGAWHHLFRERDTGSWQRAIRISPDEIRQNPIVFACMSLIANDICKMGMKLKALTSDGIWQDTQSPAFSPVLNTPNNYQDDIQFIESWMWSKLGHGNAYLLKERDKRGVVVALYPLDPFRVMPLISNDGQTAVFYQLSQDNMAGLTESVVVPAREIIHDRWYTIHHPLVGVSPLFAAELPAAQALQIQKDAIRFFRNGAQPSGILSAPGIIDPGTVKRLEDKWEEDFSGDNVGKVAVLGSGLKFETMQITALQSQVVDQLKYTGEQICSAFHVPLYKLGLGVLPAGLNIQSMNVEYLSQALQRLIHDFESCMSRGLAVGPNLSVRMNVHALLRMDSKTQMDTVGEGVKNGIYSPNEARKMFDLPPVDGGETPYLQQQNYSLAALAKRDASDDPFEAVRETLTGPAPEAAPAPPGKDSEEIPVAPPPPKPTASEDPENEGKGLSLTAMELAVIELSLTQRLGIVRR